MKTLVLNFEEFQEAREVHGFLKRKLSFPAYYGMNLDALFDMLTERQEETMLILIPAGKLFEENFRRVFEAACGQNVHIHAVLSGQFGAPGC